jgi:hypothetical protein
MSEPNVPPQQPDEMEEVLQRFEAFLRGAAAVARGEEKYRADIEALLPKLEESGWQLTAAVERIWRGERDLAQLMNGLDLQDSILIQRILDYIAQPTPQEVWDSLPGELQRALVAEDIGAANAILDAMPQADAQQIVRRLQQSGIVSAPEAESAAAPATRSKMNQAGLPPAVLAALEKEDFAALSDALQELPPQEAEGVLQRLEESGVVVRGQEALNVNIERVLRELDPLLQAVAAVAAGDEQPRASVEAALVELEESGLELLEVVQLIWVGERDANLLTADLDPISTAVAHRILALLQE